MLSFLTGDTTLPVLHSILFASTDVPTRMNERRLSQRHPLKPGLACLVYTTAGPSRGMAAAENVSAGGLRLFVTQPLLPGDLVEVELISGPTSLRRRLRVRVMHAQPEPDGGYLVGAQLLQPLSTSEVDSLAG